MERFGFGPVTLALFGLGPEVSRLAVVGEIFDCPFLKGGGNELLKLFEVLVVALRYQGGDLGEFGFGPLQVVLIDVMEVKVNDGLDSGEVGLAKN